MPPCLKYSHLLRGVDPHARLELGVVLPARRPRWRVAALDAGDRVFLLAGEAESVRRFAVQELERQDTHPDQIRAMDALERLRDNGANTQQSVPLAAQSREDPDPYSLPAITKSGVPSSGYWIDAS